MNEPEIDEIRERVEQVRSTSRALAAMDDARVVAAIANAARLLSDPETSVGQGVRTDASVASGLSREMVSWALRTTLLEGTEGALHRTLASMRAAAGTRLRPMPRHLAAVVLAGNVFTGSFRAVAMPLLFRVPVVAKASTRDDVFALWVRRALLEVDAELAASFDVLTFAGDDDERLDALLAHADVVSVFGSDRTVSSLRARLSASVAIVAHGHGLGVAYVPRDVLDDDRTSAVIDALALDVAAYDQRGCLSPHAIFVERGGKTSPQTFAERLSKEGLGPIAKTLPRGALPVAVGSQQIQWRGVSAARGMLFEGEGHAVASEDSAPLRLSPGYRNVQMIGVAGLDELVTHVAPLRTHLKALGVAGGAEARARVLAALPASLAPRVSDVGAMQTPPFDAAADGELPFAGLVRFAELD